MSTATLALRIDAPMQSWGVRSRFNFRETGTEPTKSGIVGLLAAAGGVERDDRETIAELAGLQMAVRVDREGLVERDFHTVGNVPNTEGKSPRTIVSHRYYLADALFLVLLQGGAERIEQLAAEIRAPRWPLFFGRKAFVPATPLIDPEPGPGAIGDQVTGVFPGPLDAVLRGHPWLDDMESHRLEPAPPAERPRLRVVADADPAPGLMETRYDVPVSFAGGQREFRSRTVRVEHVPVPESSNPSPRGPRPCT